MTEYLGLGSVTVRLQWTDGGAASLMASVLRYLHVEKTKESPEALLRLDIQVGAIDSISRIETESIGMYSNGLELRRDREEVLLWGSNYLARLNPVAGQGSVQVPETALEGAQQWAACGVILESLLILLRRYHFYGLHAAALVHDDRGVLITAPADCGKSTLTFRLVQSGWGYLSDDTVLLHPTPNHIEVQGLRSHFSLDPEAEEIFPELAAGREASLLKEEKWAVNVEAIYPEQRVATCVPHLLLFPEIMDAAESSVSPVVPSEAVGLLLAQSSLARTKLDGARAHLDMLGRLASSVPAYRLHSGRDLLEDPTRAATLLAPLLSEPAP